MLMLSILQCVNGILAAMVEEDMVRNNIHSLTYLLIIYIYIFFYRMYMYLANSYMHHRLQVSINFGYKSALSRKVYSYTMRS